MKTDPTKSMGDSAPDGTTRLETLADAVVHLRRERALAIARKFCLKNPGMEISGEPFEIEPDSSSADDIEVVVPIHFSVFLPVD